MNRLAVGAVICAALGCGSLSTIAQKVSTAASADAPIAGTTPDAGPATTDEIVRKLVQQNERRADQLKGYTEQRQYTVVYHGIGSMKATMTVDVHYEAPSDKQFQIVSQNGPKLLVDRVLKKLLASEQEATKNPNQTALTPANYTFSLIGQQVVAGRRCYVLHVEPRVASKYLYRGTIFVDAQDYAVVQIEAEPAQNPSFWIKKTDVHHTYAKTGQFWLPEHNRSESRIRLGGTAVLTIDYGPYHVQGVSAP
jgi:hypothetical protein